MSKRAKILSIALVSTGILAAQSPGDFLLGSGHLKPATPPPFPNAPAVAPNTALLPIWTGSYIDGGGLFWGFNMVGSDPSQGSATTTVPTVIVPVKLTFADGTVLDPTAPAYGKSASPVVLTHRSPIFQSAPWTVGGVNVGTTQYLDAFQRANFWAQVSSAAPAYHVLLGQPRISAVQSLKVPSRYGYTIAGPGNRFGQVDFLFYSTFVNNYVLAHTKPDTLLIFLVYNVGLTTANGCCTTGYHGATTYTASGATFVSAAYLDSGIFSGQEDIAAISGALANWIDDPFLINFTIPWYAGSLQGVICADRVEPGLPLIGYDFGVTLHNFIYHPSDAGFLSWFAVQSPSTAAGGWYTMNNSLTGPAVPSYCAI